MIEYQGEPLAFLKDRGFNAVRLRTLPSQQMLADAARAGMWLVCPPPMPAGLDVPAADAAPLPEIAAEFDCVLAWDLGEGLTGRELDAVKRWAEQVRRADKLGRPILCGASAELRKYQRTRPSRRAGARSLHAVDQLRAERLSTLAARAPALRPARHAGVEHGAHRASAQLGEPDQCAVGQTRQHSRRHRADAAGGLHGAGLGRGR